jgi:hypothetical protein
VTRRQFVAAMELLAAHYRRPLTAATMTNYGTVLGGMLTHAQFLAAISDAMKRDGDHMPSPMELLETGLARTRAGGAILDEHERAPEAQWPRRTKRTSSRTFCETPQFNRPSSAGSSSCSSATSPERHNRPPHRRFW